MRTKCTRFSVRINLFCKKNGMIKDRVTRKRFKKFHKTKKPEKINGAARIFHFRLNRNIIKLHSNF